MTLKKLTLKQRLILRFKGRVYIEYRTRPGWTGYLPFYRARCKKHGEFEDYPHGFNGRLECPLCQRTHTNLEETTA